MNIQFRELVSPSPLIMACIVALLIATVEIGMFMRLPLWILPLLYVFWITPNYFIEIVEHRALGHRDWPVFSQETLVAGRNQAGILFSLLLLVFAGACAALQYAGEGSLAALLLGLGLLALPASVALLAVTRAFSVALNPLRMLAAAAGMGAGYGVCLLGVAFVLGLSLFARASGQFIWYPLSVYALFLLAWLTGSVVYARRSALGVTVPGSPEVRAARARAELIAVREGILGHAYGFAMHGNRGGALKHIEAYIATEEDTPEARLWMLNRMLQWEDSAVPIEYGNRLLDYCERQGLVQEAARVRLQCAHMSGGNGARP